MATLAIGMTSAPRHQGYVTQSLASLQAAGFTEPIHVFCEPDVRKLSIPNVHQRYNAARKGCYQNFRHGLTWLLRNTDAEWLLMLQDDAIWRSDGHDIVLGGIQQHRDNHLLGMLSPYCSPAMVGRPPQITETEAWVGARFYNKAFWGALAMLFPRASAEKLLAHPRVVNHDHHRKVDVVVGNTLRRNLELQILVRVPSIVDHIGNVSTINRHRVKNIAWGRRGFQFRPTP